MELFQFALKRINVGGRKTIGGRSSTTPHLVRNVWVSRSSPLRIDQPPHDVQDVQRPAALGDGNVLQRLHALVLCADFLRRNDDCSSRRESALTFPAFSRRRWSGFIPLCGTATSDNDGNPGFGRDTVQVYVAAHPAGAARGRRKRRALDDG
jgi:hypothetical protein